MDNNQFVIRNRKDTANTEALSVLNGSISAGSIVVDDDYQTITGKLLNKKGFTDGEYVTVTGLTGKVTAKLNISDDGTFSIEIPNDKAIFFDEVKAYQDYDFIVYNGEECIIYYNTMSEYMASKRSNGSPYIMPEDSDNGDTIDVEIVVGDETKEAILPDGTVKTVFTSRRAANYGASLRVMKTSGNGLGVNLNEVYAAKVLSSNGIVCEVNRTDNTVNVLGAVYDIVEGIKKTIIYDGEELELTFDDENNCHLSSNDVVTFTCDNEQTVATMLTYDDVSGVTTLVSYTYPITSYDGVEIDGQKYTINDDDTMLYNGDTIGYFYVAGMANEYECELVPYNYGSVGGAQYAYASAVIPQALCRSVILNGGSISFVKVGGMFGSAIDDQNNLSERIEDVLEISHVYSGYTLPLFITRKIEDNISQEALIDEKFTQYEKDKAVAENPVVDMERDMYFPAYKASGVYDDYFVNNFSIVDEIRFNLHFRTRDKETMNVIEDDKSPNSFGVCNWFSTDYYDTEKMVEPRCNGAQSQFFNRNVDFALYNSSDLLGFIGFNDVDITGRAKKLSKSFIRLLFFDSPDPNTQTLLYSTTVFTDIDRLNGIHMRNIQSHSTFFDAENGYDGFIKKIDDDYTFNDMRLSGTVTACSGNELTIRYGDRDSPLFSTGEALLTRLIDKGSGSTVNEVYTYKVVKDEDIDVINRTIRLESDESVQPYTVGSRIYVYRTTRVTSTSNQYLIKNECTTFTEQLKLASEKESDGKWHDKYYPSFDDDNRLSTRFTIHGNHSIDESSDGFYLYIFKEYAKHAHPTTVYMKVEYNHAGLGQTIPFMILTDDNGKELTKMSDITSDIKAGYPIKKAIENMYIPINVVYDTKLDKYVWYYKNNNSSTLNFNLFEVKFQSIETKDVDCQLALSDYGTKVNGLSGSTSVECSNVTEGKTLSTVVTYDSHVGNWINTSISGSTVSLGYAAFPAAYYTRKMADDETLVITREGYVRIKESASCYVDYVLSQGLAGYIFASRPYVLNGTTKEYIGTLGDTKFNVDALMGTYYIDVLCDSDNWNVKLQSCTRPGGAIVIKDVPNKRVIIKTPTNTGGKNTLTYTFYTSGGDKLHEQQTVTIEQQPQDDLFNTTPGTTGGVTFTVESGNAVYYIDTNKPISSFTKSATWASVTLSSETATVSNYRYKLQITYGSNMPIGTADNSKARTEDITFVLSGITGTKTISLLQEGYTKTIINIDYRHVRFYTDDKKAKLDKSREHFDESDYTSKVFRLPNDTDYYIEFTGITSYSTSAIEVLDTDEIDMFDATVNSVLNSDGYTYKTTVTLHNTILPYSIEDRPSAGSFSRNDSATSATHILLDATKWNLGNTGYYGVEWVKLNTSGEIVDYVYEKMLLHSGNVYKIARKDGYSKMRFIRCHGEFDTKHPTINALEITPIVDVSTTNNVYVITRGFRENKYRIFNSNDPNNTTISDTFTVRQISDRYIIVSEPPSEKITFEKAGGSNEITVEVSPKTCTIEAEINSPYSKYFTAKDLNGIDLESKTNKPGSNGLFKFNIAMGVKTNHETEQYANLTLTFMSPDGTTPLFDYQWTVERNTIDDSNNPEYNIKLNNNNPSSVVDLSRNGTIVNINPKVSVVLDNSISSYVTYSWDTSNNIITFRLPIDEAGQGGYTGESTVTGNAYMFFYDSEGSYCQETVRITLEPIVSNGQNTQENIA